MFPDILTCWSDVSEAQEGGRDPDRPGLLDIVDEVRAVIADQLEGIAPPSPLSWEMTRSARWFKDDQ